MLRSRSRFNGASASMPRMGRQHVRHVDGEGASTGPRHRCRGWTFFLGMHRLLLCSFNGASASMPRMAPKRARCFRSSGCFNGASASMPRMARRTLQATIRRPNQLRFRLGPESAISVVANVKTEGEAIAGLASTGPRHRCRGWVFAQAPVAPSGRRFNGASASMPRMEHHTEALEPSWSSFNGASASMPRMVARAAATARAASGLQRGLGIDAEDGTRTIFSRPRSRPASTGPRHRCRGWYLSRGANIPARRASTGPRHRCRGWR